MGKEDHTNQPVSNGQFQHYSGRCRAYTTVTNVISTRSKDWTNKIPCKSWTTLPENWTNFKATHLHHYPFSLSIR